MKFRLHLQDYRGHKFGAPRPPVVFVPFETKQQAEEALRDLRVARGPDIVATIAPEPTPRKTRGAKPQHDLGFPPAGGPRRLTE